MVAALGPQADARSIFEPQAPLLRLLLGNLQSLAPPDPLDPFPFTAQPASRSKAVIRRKT